MEKYFVTYNQSLALKMLGFDEPCFGWYEHNGNFYYCYQEGLVPPSPSKKLIKGCCLAPLKSQVFEWFRKNHSIHGIVSYYGKSQWNIEILDYKGNELIQIEDNTFWSYEEAESACIDKLIEIIKDGRKIN
jgi:hypothetical protein